jgi:hypothetical protein
MRVSTITPRLACPGRAKRAHRDHDEPVSSVLLVREGGVEPPRPCGHWNLNPARLPIPPPAHWVCPRACPPWGLRLPTCRRLARWRGRVHIPYRRPTTRPSPPWTPPGTPSNPPHLPLRINVCRFTYQPRTGPGHLPRRRTRSTVRCGTLVCGPLYDPGQE